MLSVLVIGSLSTAFAAPVLIEDPNSPVLQGATVIDFDSSPFEPRASWTFNGEVTFSSASGALWVGEGEEDGEVVFGGYELTDVRMDFSGPGVSAFGFYLYAAFPLWQVTLFGNTGNNIGSLALPDIIDDAYTYDYYTAFTTDDGDLISYAILSPINYQPDFITEIIIDNVAYVSSNNISTPVPEPGTLRLIGMGVIGLAGFKKRFF